MNSKAALAIGTSRPDGNTWSVLRGANEGVRLSIFDLASMRVSYSDYHHANLGDDFITIIEELLEFDTIGLVTPVYWYSVSA
jgi:multimeric flavodoxin WrbA